MSEILQVFNSVFHVISFILVVLLIPLIKFLFDLRLKIERIEIMLDIILKDVERLKKEIWDGKESED
jgi:hypothetical protein